MDVMGTTLNLLRLRAVSCLVGSTSTTYYIVEWCISIPGKTQ